MIWIVIVIVIAIILLFFSSYHWKDMLFEAGVVLFVGIFLSVAMMGLCTSIFDSFAKQYKEVDYSKTIYAIQDNSSIEGKIRGGIFYTRGKVEEVEYYYYLCNGSYGKRTEKVPVNETYIIETDGNYRIEICKSKYKNKWVKLLTGLDYAKQFYVIYVPYGTTTNNYSIDLQY